MDWEAIVNQHSNSRENRTRYKKMKKHLQRVMLSVAVAIVFLVATACNLVKPVLGMPVMVIALMIGSYNFGRAKGSV